MIAKRKIKTLYQEGQSRAHGLDFDLKSCYIYSADETTPFLPTCISDMEMQILFKG